MRCSRQTRTGLSTYLLNARNSTEHIRSSPPPRHRLAATSDLVHDSFSFFVTNLVLWRQYVTCSALGIYNQWPASQPACIACQRLSRCGGASTSYRSGLLHGLQATDSGWCRTGSRGTGTPAGWQARREFPAWRYLHHHKSVFQCTVRTPSPRNSLRYQVTLAARCRLLHIESHPRSELRRRPNIPSIALLPDFAARPHVISLRSFQRRSAKCIAIHHVCR